MPRSAVTAHRFSPDAQLLPARSPVGNTVGTLSGNDLQVQRIGEVSRACPGHLAYSTRDRARCCWVGCEGPAPDVEKVVFASRGGFAASTAHHNCRSVKIAPRCGLATRFGGVTTSSYAIRLVGNIGTYRIYRGCIGNVCSVEFSHVHSGPRSRHRECRPEGRRPRRRRSPLGAFGVFGVGGPYRCVADQQGRAISQPTAPRTERGRPANRRAAHGQTASGTTRPRAPAPRRRIGKEPDADSARHDQLVIPVILVIDADIAQHRCPADQVAREDRSLQPDTVRREVP